MASTNSAGLPSSLPNFVLMEISQMDAADTTTSSAPMMIWL
jgi:hypothetical protein